MAISMTIDQRDDAIDIIERLAQAFVESVDWRSESDDRMVRIAIAPNGRVSNGRTPNGRISKVIRVKYRIESLSRPLFFYIDNQGDFYHGGERGFGSSTGRQVWLRDYSDAVLHAVAAALAELIATAPKAPAAR